MITFNDVLREGGVDPAKVKLLRHTVRGKQIHEIWRSDRGLVEAYQSRQKSMFFDGVDHAACFVVSRGGTTVFGGLYRVEGSTPALPDDLDPLTGDPHNGHRVIYDLVPEPAFEQYEDRLVVQWFLAGKHPGWWQWAHKNPKPIAEIATQQERPFPGWLEFRSPVDELDGLPRTWREVLRSTSGVYLLTDAHRQALRRVRQGRRWLPRTLGRLPERTVRRKRRPCRRRRTVQSLGASDLRPKYLGPDHRADRVAVEGQAGSPPGRLQPELRRACRWHG